MGNDLVGCWGVGSFGRVSGLRLGFEYVRGDVLIDDFNNIFLDENDIFSTFTKLYCVLNTLKDLFLKIWCEQGIINEILVISKHYLLFYKVW